MNPDEQPQGVPPQPSVPPVLGDETPTAEQLLNIDQEPSTGGAPSASSLHGPTDPVPVVGVVDLPEPETTPSPAAAALFGAPVANLSSTTTSEMPIIEPPKVATEIIDSPVAKKSTGSFIDSVKPVAKPGLSTDAQEDGESLVPPVQAAEPVSGAIDSILESRDKSDKDDKKDIKLPSAKKGKGGLIAVITALVLLVGTAGAWFFMVKSPADAAGSAYSANAERYMQQVAQMIDESAGNAEGVAVALEALDKPVLEATLLSDLSFSGPYADAKKLEGEVNSKVSGYIGDLKSYGDIAELFDDYQEADAQLQDILSRAMSETDTEKISAVYTEYISAIEKISKQFEEGTFPSEFDAIRTEIIAAFDEEIVAARAYVTTNDTVLNEGEEGEEAEAIVEEETVPTDSDAEDPTLHDAVNTRRTAAHKIGEYIASVTEAMQDMAEDARKYADSL